MSNQEVVKICVDKLTASDQRQLNTLRNMNPSTAQYRKLSAAFYTQKLWPNNKTVNIVFLEEPKNITRTKLSVMESARDANGNPLKLDPLQYKVEKMGIIPAIITIVNERINPIVNLKFKFTRVIADAQIRITFDPNGGAWSLLGTDCLKEKGPTMNFGWFDVATTIHEFGHAIGMVHEHQNPKRNKIMWDKEKVYAWAKQTQGWDKETTYHNIVEKYDSNQINGSDYDPLSIMLYFFPGSLTTNNIGTQQNLRLSPYDVEYINANYKNSPQTPSEFYKKAYNEKIANTITKPTTEKPAKPKLPKPSTYKCPPIKKCPPVNKCPQKSTKSKRKNKVQALSNISITNPIFPTIIGIIILLVVVAVVICGYNLLKNRRQRISTF